MSESDYIDRTIATVRNHRNADNCWPQWANIFADEIESLRELNRILTRDYNALLISSTHEREDLRAEIDRLHKMWEVAIEDAKCAHVDTGTCIDCGKTVVIDDRVAVAGEDT